MVIGGWAYLKFWPYLSIVFELKRTFVVMSTKKKLTTNSRFLDKILECSIKYCIFGKFVLASKANPGILFNFVLVI